MLFRSLYQQQTAFSPSHENQFGWLRPGWSDIQPDPDWRWQPIHGSDHFQHRHHHLGGLAARSIFPEGNRYSIGPYSGPQGIRDRFRLSKSLPMIWRYSPKYIHHKKGTLSRKSIHQSIHQGAPPALLRAKRKAARWGVYTQDTKSYGQIRPGINECGQNNCPKDRRDARSQASNGACSPEGTDRRPAEYAAKIQADG